MYESNAKQTFGRGWAINRIIERLPVHPYQARILLLAGEDHDRQCLIRRGFSNHNILSVDRDMGAVERVRANGGVAIHGPVEEVLRCWPDDWRVDAVLLDFNCGFDRPVCLALSALLAKPFRRATVYLNLQRGRDWYGKIVSDKQLIRGKLIFPTKNRAELALLTWVQTHVTAAPDSYKFSYSEQWEILNVLFAELNRVLAKPYRQRDCGVLMDGCVFTAPDESWGVSIKSDDIGLTRRVTAARAVATRLKREAAA